MNHHSASARAGRVLFGVFLAASAHAAGGVSANVPAEAASMGVNLAGAEFGKVPGRPGQDYGYPTAADLDYFKSRGMTVIRLPFKWERMQRTVSGPLDEAELKRMDEVVAWARERGLKLLLDLHNYAAYDGRSLGTPELPDEAFADFWKRLASHYASETAIFAYGLMNEPVKAQGRWPASAQAAVDAIRAVDTNHTISVCGEGWSGAHSWKKANKDLQLHDPTSNLVYEAHQYFDRDNSGRYQQGYDDSGAHPQLGVERLRPFAEWLREHNARGFLGEFGVPGDDPRWIEVLDHFLAALRTNQIGGTYWAAGPRWGNYPLSVQPAQGRDRPQMEALALYAGDRTRSPDVKASYDDAAARMKASGRRIVYNLRSRGESYHYKNAETEFTSTVVVDEGRDVRQIAYRHRGHPAYVGIGLFFGGLKGHDQAAFVLTVRAEKPCGLDAKAFAPDKSSYSAHFQVGTAWQDLVIPFAALQGAKGGFDAVRVLEKLELQPGADAAGNRLFLGELMLLRQWPNGR